MNVRSDDKWRISGEKAILKKIKGIRKDGKLIKREKKKTTPEARKRKKEKSGEKDGRKEEMERPRNTKREQDNTEKLGKEERK